LPLQIKSRLTGLNDQIASTEAYRATLEFMLKRARSTRVDTLGTQKVGAAGVGGIGGVSARKDAAITPCLRRHLRTPWMPTRESCS